LQALLSDWPVPRPKDWLTWVNQPQTAAEVNDLREHVRRSRPYGNDAWIRQTAAQLGLAWTLHRRGGYRRKFASTQQQGS
jgi:putative transposase